MIKTNGFDDKKNNLIILVQHCKILGIQLEVNRCVLCGSNKIKTISLKQYGMLCDECFNKQQHQSFDLSISKLIHYLFNEKYSEIDHFSQSYDQVVGLLLVFIKDNAGIQLKTLKHYWM
jgi:recombinational DNA repair protein (RecF pathway)